MNAQQLLDALMANLPLIITIAGATGLLGFVAGNIRGGVKAMRAAAAKTPSKFDDALVDLVDDPLLKAADLVQRGDVQGGLDLVHQVRGAVKARRR